MNVISFALWGTNPAFFQGAVENVLLARSIYPNWNCWFFVESRCPDDWGRTLNDLGALVTPWTETRGAWEGLFQRFQPIWSPEVDVTIVRDCDSRVNPREKAAVDEWLSSDALAHTMRDHIEHQVPMLGGMIGFRRWPEFQRCLNDWTAYGAKGLDQEFLKEHIWPILTIKGDVIAHDLYPSGITIPLVGQEPYTEYTYDPVKFFGRHDIKPFPEHAPLDPVIHGAHVGARVGI